MNNMIRSLRPGGSLLHRIDLRPLGMFPTEHELTWLRFSNTFWRGMTCYWGRPNRQLLHRYRELVKRSELSTCHILVTSLVGGTVIEPPRPYDEIESAVRQKAESIVENCRKEFSKEFRAVSTQDLAVNGIVLIAEKA